MHRITVKVTDQDIKAARYKHLDGPLARAIRNTVGHDRIFVGHTICGNDSYDSATIHDMTYRLSDNATNYIYDEYLFGGDVEPGTVELFFDAKLASASWFKEYYNHAIKGPNLFDILRKEGMTREWFRS